MKKLFAIAMMFTICFTFSACELEESLPSESSDDFKRIETKVSLRSVSTEKDFEMDATVTSMMAVKNSIEGAINSPEGPIQQPWVYFSYGNRSCATISPDGNCESRFLVEVEVSNIDPSFLVVIFDNDKPVALIFPQNTIGLEWGEGESEVYYQKKLEEKLMPKYAGRHHYKIHTYAGWGIYFYSEAIVDVPHYWTDVRYVCEDAATTDIDIIFGIQPYFGLEVDGAMFTFGTHGYQYPEDIKVGCEHGQCLAYTKDISNTDYHAFLRGWRMMDSTLITPPAGQMYRATFEKYFENPDICYYGN